MTSKFTSPAKRKRSPSWCKPGMFPVPQLFVPEGPSYIIASALWLDYGVSPPWYLSESLTITWNAGTGIWHGNTTPSGLHLELDLEPTPDPELFDVALSIWSGSTELEVQIWDTVRIPPGPPFDSGRLEFSAAPPNDLKRVHLLA